ncbi:YbaN family protein [Caldimonas sp. KR1-144]|uniref:YbaN family protein n=1 Tax=Caldimonas sp. KR1-144 TaxID=3400911 RepID=UPI003BFDAE67
MKRSLLLGAGVVSLALGIAGIALPLLPTTPFVLLAAACFAHANPAWERRLLEHPRYGPSIRAWRERGAIPLVAKRAAIAMLLISAIGGAFMLSGGWRFVPGTVALLVGGWILTRPSA